MLYYTIENAVLYTPYRCMDKFLEFFAETSLIWGLALLFWAGLAFFTAKHYHGNAPVSLQDELDKELN